MHCGLEKLLLVHWWPGESFPGRNGSGSRLEEFCDS